jgi:hypothetical protein
VRLRGARALLPPLPGRHHGQVAPPALIAENPVRENPVRG